MSAVPDNSSPPKLCYDVLDREPQAVLQVVELLHVNGNWHYYRCPQSGLEWHTNGDGFFWAQSPIAAWALWSSSCTYRLEKALACLYSTFCSHEPFHKRVEAVKSAYSRLEHAWEQTDLAIDHATETTHEST